MSKGRGLTKNSEIMAGNHKKSAMKRAFVIFWAHFSAIHFDFRKSICGPSGGHESSDVRVFVSCSKVVLK